MNNTLPKLLIVDDKPANLTALKLLLSNVEAEVIQANEGNTALALSLEHDFALILLDVHMPGMDGYEVAQLLREEERTQKTPIVFVTASYYDDHHRLKGYETGAVDYLMKPVDKRILITKVQVFLDLYNHRRMHELNEELLSEKNSQLEMLVGELKTARDLAMEATYSKSRFLATMSHEIRTPMNGVLGMAHLLSETTLTEKQRLYLKTIQGSGETLLTVINDILDFSKIEADKIVLETIPFDLEEILESTIQIFKKITLEKKIGPHIQLFPGIPSILMGDPNRLRQVLFNLIGNAIKFTEIGVVSIFVQPVGETDSNIDLKFSIDDTGVGIATENLKNLFTPFMQADDSTTRRFGGTGLGLSISSKLVELMGGKIHTLSKPGVGSSFRFVIRLEKPTQNMLAKLAHSATLKKETPHNGKSTDDYSNHRLLLVEDDPTNSLFMNEFLGKFQFKAIDMANNGQEAVELSETNRYGLILMDCQMPVMDGFEATRQIRKLEQSKNFHTPIIALTASVFAQDQEQCLTAGMDAFLPKPFQIPKLLELIKHYLKTEEKPIEPTKEPKNITQTETPILDKEGFQSLCDTLGETGVKNVIQALLNSLPEKLETLHQAIATNDPQDLHKKAHILKGNYGMIQATPLVALCQELVEIGRSGTVDGADPLLKKLVKKNNTLEEVLGKMLI